MFEELISCAANRWELRAGDPTLIGWLITLAYFMLNFSIVKLLFNISSSNIYDRRRFTAFWIIILLIYLFFGLNKQLDLQTFLTATGRCVSKLQGWYEERRAFQFNLIMAGLAATAMFMLGFLYFFRTIIGQSLLALLGVSCSMVFVVLRAASIHHVDQLFRIEFFNVKAHAIIEMTGIVLVFVNVITMAWILRRWRYGKLSPR